MKNVQPNEELRNNYVFSSFKNHFKILKFIKTNPRPTYSQIRDSTNLSNGLIYNLIKDSKIMKLVENGYGLTITSLGEKWINSVLNDGKVSNEILREACRNVSYFNKVYTEDPSNIDYGELYNLFSKLDILESNKRNIGAMVKRYLESFHNIRIGIGSNIVRIKRNQENLNDIKTKPKEKLENKSNQELITAIKIVTEIKKIEEKYGKEVIKAVIENL